MLLCKTYQEEQRKAHMKKHPTGGSPSGAPDTKSSVSSQKPTEHSKANPATSQPKVEFGFIMESSHSITTGSAYLNIPCEVCNGWKTNTHSQQGEG
jgi:hypothetical protein